MSENKIKPKAPIIGADGNIFNIVGIASRSLRKEGLYEEANEMATRAFSTQNYDQALSVVLEYIDPVDVYEYDNDFGGMDYE